MPYQVSVLYWTRSFNGDDWVDSEDFHYFDDLDEAQIYAKNVLYEKTRLIEVKVLDQETRKEIAVYNREKDITIPDSATARYEDL